jgi:hypothetical protein
MKILTIREVRIYLQNLASILYKKEYFGLEDSAKKYVVDLFNDIKTNLPKKTHRPAPAYFDKYGKGMYYARFKKNNNTTWYVFFRVYRRKDEDIYQIRYIGNNHTIAQYLQ